MLGILSEAAAVENSHNSEHLIRQVMRETGWLTEYFKLKYSLFIILC